MPVFLIEWRDSDDGISTVAQRYHTRSGAGEAFERKAYLEACSYARRMRENISGIGDVLKVERVKS